MVLWRRALVVLVAFAVSGFAGVGGPSSALAASTSNIPGVPLPGPVVSGQLGGPIYDVVFSLDVPSGYVVVANLSAAPGTLFGLYLFDSTATTVESTQGLVAQSTTVGTAQHISYPVLGGGTYYIDLNGASNVPGLFTLTVQLVPDSTTPVVSLALDEGRTATNSPKVSVSLTARAGISGVSEMAFSLDGTTWQPWQPYLIATSYTFPSGDGEKHLWVRVRSGIGLVSAPAEASITLDTVPPTIVSVAPPRDSTAGELRPTISVTFSEVIDPSTWQRLGLVMQAPSGALVSGDYTYDAISLTGTFTPSSDLQPGVPYAVTVGPVTDVAGNHIVPVASWTITPLLPVSATLTTSPRVVVSGAPVTLAGSVSPAGRPATLQGRSSVSATFSDVASLPASSGLFKISVTPAMNTWYRVNVPGSPILAAAQSPEVRVIVRRTVVLEGASATATSAARPGSAVTLRAATSPAAAGLTVSFRLYRYDPLHRRYVYAGSHGARTTADGVATFHWVPTSGTYYWRALVYPTPEFANNISPVYRWVVR